MANDKFKLEDDDVAIIIKKDMTFELVLPNIDENKGLSPNDQQNIFVGVTIVSSLNDEDFRTMIATKMDRIFPPTDPPAGCSGGDCGGCSC